MHHWLYIHMSGQFFIILWTSYFYNMVLDLFIPITGRSGSARNPDAIISVLCCATILFMCSYMVRLLVQPWTHLTDFSSRSP